MNRPAQKPTTTPKTQDRPRPAQTGPDRPRPAQTSPDRPRPAQKPTTTPKTQDRPRRPRHPSPMGSFGNRTEAATNQSARKTGRTRLGRPQPTRVARKTGRARKTETKTKRAPGQSEHFRGRTRVRCICVTCGNVSLLLVEFAVCGNALFVLGVVVSLCGNGCVVPVVRRQCRCCVW